MRLTSDLFVIPAQIVASDFLFFLGEARNKALMPAANREVKRRELSDSRISPRTDRRGNVGGRSLLYACLRVRTRVRTSLRPFLHPKKNSAVGMLLAYGYYTGIYTSAVCIGAT